MLTKTNKRKNRFLAGVFFLFTIVSFLFNAPAVLAAGISSDTGTVSDYLKKIAVSPEVGLGGSPTSVPTMIGALLYGLLLSVNLKLKRLSHKNIGPLNP